MKFCSASLVFLLALPALAQEQEPNNDFSTATTIQHGDVIRGDLTPNDNDFFVLRTNGQATLLFYTAQPNGGARIDTTLTLYSGAQDPPNQIAYNDDDFGNGRGVYSGIQRNNAAAGTYYIKVAGFGGRQNGPYELHCELSGGPDLSVTGFALNPLPAPDQVWGANVTVNNAIGASPAGTGRDANRARPIASASVDPPLENRNCLTCWTGAIGFGSSTSAS